MARQIRVLIVDNQLRSRRSLNALLATFPEIQEVHEAINGQQAVRLAEELLPDVVVMDVRMPVMDGLEATRLIKKKWPQACVILLSMYPEYRVSALEVGAYAFVHKGDPPETLLQLLEGLIAAAYSGLM